MAYISLPRGQPRQMMKRGISFRRDEQQEDEEDLFNIKLQSLLIGAAIASGSCFIFLLVVELLVRSVKSWEKSPGNAYNRIKHEQENLSSRKQVEKHHSNLGHNDNPIPRYKPSEFVILEENIEEVTNIVTSAQKKTNKGMSTYLEKFLKYIKAEYGKYETLKDSLKKDIEDEMDRLLKIAKSASSLDQLIIDLTQSDFSLEDLLKQDMLGWTESLERINSLNTIPGPSSIALPKRTASEKLQALSKYFQKTKSRFEEFVIEIPELRIDGEQDGEVKLDINDINLEYNENVDEDGNDIGVVGDTVDKTQDENAYAVGEENVEISDAEIDIHVIPSGSERNVNDNKSKTIEKPNIQLVMPNCRSRRSGLAADLNEAHLSALVFFLAAETITFIICSVHNVLSATDVAALADLVLLSHSTMLALEHAADTIVYLVNNPRQRYLLSCLKVTRSCEAVYLAFLETAFALSVHFNQMSWRSLKVLVVKEFLCLLDRESQIDMLEFLNCHIREQSEETLVLKRLCAFGENEAQSEVWEQLHDHRSVFADMLIKQQVLRVLHKRMSRLTKRKKRFDVKHDLLPKEPKSRLQIMVEKRKGVLPEVHEGGGPQVHFAEGQETLTQEQLKEKSADIGRQVEGFRALHHRLSMKWKQEGLRPDIEGGRLLAQSALVPSVVVCSGDTQPPPGKYKFDTVLKLKRVEALMCQFYEVTVQDMAKIMLLSIETDFDMAKISPESPVLGCVIENIIIKVDTMSHVLQEDVFDIMTMAVNQELLRNTLDLDHAHMSSISIMKKSQSIMNWSGMNLENITSSEMIHIQEELAAEGQAVEVAKVLDYFSDKPGPQTNVNNSSIQQDISYSGNNMTVVQEMTTENEEKTWSIKHILQAWLPLKEYVQFILGEEVIHSQVTQLNYLERCKETLDFLQKQHLANVVDSYFMLEEGDDSHTLLKAGLYQLEHDCMGEDRKPLPGFVKSLSIFVMLFVMLFSVIYVSVAVGQLSTVDLQEYLCYYAMAVGIYGFGLETVRGVLVSLYVSWLYERLWKRHS
ncbi:uncharacterized protein LOC128235190 isoform X2 [Mya arenaria]|nr:uncharacterized protein LOC128235190 isoform X2 [Mya arenaria]